jgi:carboxyl-terminal processing protease
MNRTSKGWNFRRLLLVIGIIVTLFGTAFTNRTPLFDITRNLEIFTSVYKNVFLHYVEDVNAGEVIKTGIDAMLSSLDPYTNYYTEAQAEDAIILQKGDYGSPGIELMLLGGKLTVSLVQSGSSAEENGVQLGDIIRQINGRDFEGKGIQEAYESFKGAVGSRMVIQVERNKELLLINLIRRKQDMSNVSYYGLVNPETGYIKLDQFMLNSADDVRNAFIQLKKDHQIRYLVLDLRNNGGGLLMDAVRILNIFVPKNQLMVVMSGRSEEHYREYYTFENPVDTLIPITVLINANSASASEIVSGAIQDLDRGVVIGQTSFGKGLVQNQLPLPYRHGMKITIAKYYIPSGRCIQQLDYSKKKKTDTSSASVFYTLHKRKVLEGNGIEPDLKTEIQKNPIIQTLQKQHLIFDFVTSIRPDLKAAFGVHPEQTQDSTKENLLLPDHFTISDDLYRQFMAFVKQKNVVYETAIDRQIQQLETEWKAYESRFEGEGQRLSGTSTLFQQLKIEAEKMREKEWSEAAPFIKSLLHIEIARNFMGEKQKFTTIFKYDKEVQASLQLFSNMRQYRQILTP